MFNGKEPKAYFSFSDFHKLGNDRTSAKSEGAPTTEGLKLSMRDFTPTMSDMKLQLKLAKDKWIVSLDLPSLRAAISMVA
ncbi:hypothetical protein F2Q68_00030533 [Brassica cretica]|uniref:Uncharacterized protein n=1 Tax=Brassica cretica TaxID=69181 RepID=A0A8S9GDL6_BRACR|nr:hypothetical protein F2Q68_00030533 [Brassica cretica]